MKKESLEIFKAIEKAVYQVDKYKSFVYDISDRHQKRILGGDVGTAHDLTMSSSSRTSSTSSLPRVIDFQVGDPVMRQSSTSSGGAGAGYVSFVDSETLSLIDENHILLDA